MPTTNKINFDNKICLSVLDGTAMALPISVHSINDSMVFILKFNYQLMLALMLMTYDDITPGLNVTRPLFQYAT